MSAENFTLTALPALLTNIRYDDDDETLHLHLVKQVWPPAKNWAETSLKMLSASNVQVKIQASCRKVKIGRQMNKDPN